MKHFTVNATEEGKKKMTSKSIMLKLKYFVKNTNHSRDTRK